MTKIRTLDSGTADAGRVRLSAISKLLPRA